MSCKEKPWRSAAIKWKQKGIKAIVGCKYTPEESELSLQVWSIGWASMKGKLAKLNDYRCVFLYFLKFIEYESQTRHTRDAKSNNASVDYTSCKHKKKTNIWGFLSITSDCGWSRLKRKHSPLSRKLHSLSSSVRDMTRTSTTQSQMLHDAIVWCCASYDATRSCPRDSRPEFATRKISESIRKLFEKLHQRMENRVDLSPRFLLIP